MSTRCRSHGGVVGGGEVRQEVEGGAKKVRARGARGVRGARGAVSVWAPTKIGITYQTKL